MKLKIVLITFLCLILSMIVMADNSDYDSRNMNENSIYNVSNIVISNTSGSAGFTGLGDLFVLSNAKIMEGVFVEAQQYGAGLEISNNDLVTTYNNVLSANATLTSATKTIYDSEASFNDTYKGQFIRVISSAGISFSGATAEIETVFNSTHLEVSFGSFYYDFTDAKPYDCNGAMWTALR